MAGRSGLIYISKNFTFRNVHEHKMSTGWPWSSEL